MKNTMTASQLKYEYQSRNNGHFFDRSSIKFFGDTMRNYGVRAKTELVETPTGNFHECFVLYRKHPVKCGLQREAYFSKETFKQVIKGK